MKASNKSLNFMYLNVCGLKAKLNIPELNELIQSFAVITCAETKLRKDRMQKVTRRSGGLAVLINDIIYKHFKYVESECEYILWFKVDKALFQTNEDVYFVAE